MMITRKDVHLFATNNHITSEELDEPVYTASEDLVSRVNNSGVHEQIEYLVDSWGSNEVLKELEKLVQYREHNQL